MKKVLALVLALTMALGMSTVAFAATQKITDLTAGNILEFDTNDVDFRAGDSIILTFVDAGGGDSNMLYADNTPVKIADITKSMLSNSKITVKKTASKGGDLINSVGFEKIDGEIVVEVELVDEFVSVKEKDFDFKVVLYQNSKKVEEYSYSGTMTFEVLDLYDGDDYVNLEDGEVAKAHEYIRGVEVYLGEGVSMTVNMFSGKSYYGTANQKVSGSDLNVLNKYPEIQTVYTLNTVNLSGGGNIVTFDLDDTYYVYNAEGVYVGTSLEKLPFSGKYYLASSRITMVEESSATEEPTEQPAEVEEPETTDSQAPNMGGDDGDVADSINENPATGVSGMASLAVVAGVVALAGAGAIALKK